MKKEELTRYHTYDDWYTGDKILEFPPQTTEEHNYSLDTHVVESDAEWYNIEEVDKLLDFKDKQLSETEKKLKETYEYIIDDYREYNKDFLTERCNRCSERYGKHVKGCIVGKAQTWLKDKE